MLGRILGSPTEGSALRTARFVLIQLLILFVLGEVALRILRETNDNVRILLYMPSVTTGFDDVNSLPELMSQTIVGHQPFTEYAGFIRNAHGFRTPEYETEKAEGTVRVLAIGDSFSFSSGGIPYSLGWNHLLSEALDAGHPAPVEFITLAAPGTGPLFERRLWQLEGARLKPDVLMLVLFVGNDFTDHYDKDLKASGVNPLARISYTVRFVRNAARVLGARGNTAVEEVRVGDTATSNQRGGFELPEYLEYFKTRPPLMTHDRLMELESQRARLIARSQEGAYLELLERMTTVLRDLRDEVEASGTEFRVVVIPDRFQVNLDERTEVLTRLQMTDADFFAWDRPQRDLFAFFEEEGIEALDLMPAFQSEPENRYDAGNTHWDVAGNAVAAREMAAWLLPQLPRASAKN